jgi:hypothetical protein
LSPSLLDRLVGGNDKFIMVRCIAPETGQNNMVVNKEEFQSMVDYVFYLSTMCKDQLTFLSSPSTCLTC